MWANLWIKLFGSVDGWMGLDWGFWVSMAIVALVVIIENIVFWSFKPLPIAEIIRAQEAEDNAKERAAKAANKGIKKYR